MSEKKYFLALTMIKGLGSTRISNLLKHFGDAYSIWQANERQLKAVNGIGKLAEKIIKQKESININKLLEEINRKKINYTTLVDDKYPKILKNIYDPPPVLFYKGKLNFEYPAISIIGSRRSTTYGRKYAEKLAYELAQRGVTVISGMARGIDTCAHVGTLKAKGRTIAVLGSGLDIIYPSENRDLAKEIQNEGAIISEYPPGVKPLSANFPQRNRIISGLSRGILVIEAADRSGSLITANLALEQGRELFAIPGNIDRPQSRGCNRLIQNGAKMVTNVDDILEELYLYKETNNNYRLNKDNKESYKANYPELSEKEKNLIKIFENEREMKIDKIISKSGKRASEVNALLLKLELKGVLKREAGKKYVFMGLQSLLKPI
ncbi:DNA-processing protein DprA [Natronospora cellulosivora (SeqCode)]